MHACGICTQARCTLGLVDIGTMDIGTTPHEPGWTCCCHQNKKTLRHKTFESCAYTDYGAYVVFVPT